MKIKKNIFIALISFLFLFSLCIFCLYHLSPHYIVKQYCKNRFTYSYLKLDEMKDTRIKLLSNELIKANIDKFNNLQNDIIYFEYSSKLKKYKINSYEKQGNKYIFKVKTTSKIISSNSNLGSEITLYGEIVVIKVGFFKYKIVELNSLDDEEIEHEH